MSLFTIDEVFGGWAVAQKTHFADAVSSTGSARLAADGARRRERAIEKHPARIRPLLGFTVLYLSLIVLLPLCGLLLKCAGLGWDQFWQAVSAPRALASYRLSFGAAVCGGLINAVFGLLVAWVLVRYPFRGRRVVDAMVDLPFALPTAVAGIALTTAYAAGGMVGRPLAALGIQGAFSPFGVIIALTFIGLRSSSARSSRCWKIWIGRWRRRRPRWEPGAGRPSAA